MTKQFPFEITFQFAIIKMMLKDDHFLEHCSLYLKDDYFESIYLGWLFGKVVDFFNKFHKRPSLDTIQNEISKFSNDQRLPYKTIFDKVMSCEFDDESYLREELSSFVKAVVFMKKQSAVIDLYNSGEYEDAFAAVRETAKEIDNVDFSEEDCVNFDNLEGILEKIRKDTGNKTKLGISMFDKAMNGGVPDKTLVVYLGATNVGKSIVLINQAVNFMNQGKKVLFIDVEMSEDIVTTRFLACITGISLNRLIRDESFLSDEERQKIRAAKEILKAQLKLKILHEEGVYIEDVSRICNTQKKKFNFDAAIVDYGQALSIKEKYSSNYERQGEIYRRLGRIALSHNIIMVTAAQGTRAAQSLSRNSKKANDLLRMEDISESFHICRKAGVVITITKSERDEANDKIKLLLDKQRIGRTNIAVIYHTDFNCSRVFGPDMAYEPFSAVEGEDE